MNIVIDFNLHPDFEKAVQWVFDDDLMVKVDSKSLVGKKIKSVELSAQHLLIGVKDAKDP